MKYEYSFPTGTICTDSDNLAAILYDIRKCETISAFGSDSQDELDEMLGEAYALIIDIMVHFRKYVIECAKEFDTAQLDEIENRLREISVECDDARDDESDIKQMQFELKNVYHSLLCIIPRLNALTTKNIVALIDAFLSCHLDEFKDMWFRYDEFKQKWDADAIKNLEAYCNQFDGTPYLVILPQKPTEYTAMGYQEALVFTDKRLIYAADTTHKSINYNHIYLVSSVQRAYDNSELIFFATEYLGLDDLDSHAIKLWMTPDHTREQRKREAELISLFLYAISGIPKLKNFNDVEDNFAMNEKMNEILNTLSDIDCAMIVRPATQKDVAQCVGEMNDMDFPAIPSQYIDFISFLNGFAFNGIEFYSTDQVTDPETNFMLNDIVSANEEFVSQNEGFEHCVMLGRSDEDLFVFNTVNNRYEVLDMTGRDVMDDYESFEDMFIGVVSPRIYTEEKEEATTDMDEDWYFCDDADTEAHS